MMQHSPPRIAQAVIAVSCATGLFAGIFASEKFVRLGWPEATFVTVQIMALRYLSGLACVMLAIAALRVPLTQLRSRQVGVHGLRAACGLGAGMTIISASAAMPILDATALSLMSSVVMIAIGILFFGERIGKYQMCATLICITGAAVILSSRGAFRSLHPDYMWPATLALVSAIFIAVEGALIKRLALAEQTLGVLLYVNAFGVLFAGSVAVLVWQPLPPALTLSFLALGPVAILAQGLNIYGYRHATLSVIAPLDFLWLVFAAGFGLVLFREAISLPSLVGSGMIIAGGVLLATRRR